MVSDVESIKIKNNYTPDRTQMHAFAYSTFCQCLVCFALIDVVSDVDSVKTKNNHALTLTAPRSMHLPI